MLRAKATVACQSQKIENVQKKSHSLPTHHAMHASNANVAPKKNMDSSKLLHVSERSAGANAHDLVFNDRKTKIVVFLLVFVFISAMATSHGVKWRREKEH